MLIGSSELNVDFPLDYLFVIKPAGFAGFFVSVRKFYIGFEIPHLIHIVSFK
ncbi:hypothetical protein PAUR_b0150 [Pseudoalteromonas aurantia 208]|uniref:Uncharacterized protein n=1 Tax=Pseudoalteromonas aurantia 208 TaxID=1314867 RepID=A0ABR9EGR3_9GAMM|nr:hypothetical protein [Pseudoalteromonas aurantia 208]